MLGACSAGEVFALLEGGGAGGGGSGSALLALYGAVREPWLTRALLAYHARTGSARAVELLARAPEPHAKHLLDALHEQLREPAARRAALLALAPLLARRPAWLHRLQPPHPLPRELLRAARTEREVLPLLYALMALAALLPAAPALAASLAPELADALLRPAQLEPAPPAPARDHLLLAQLALFRALYATHPVTLLEALRAEHAAASAATRDAWQRGLAPLLASVRLHPALVTGSRAREADAGRWARLEWHDVVAETRRLSLTPRERQDERERPAQPPPAPAAPVSPAPGCGAHAARAASALRPGTDPWFPLAERCGADSAPHTPLPAEADPGEPPEAAVEATPENTPAKETRERFRFPAESSAVRAIGRRSQPPSPLRKETSPLGGAGPSAGDAYAGRLTRMALDRAALEAEGGGRASATQRRGPDSPVPFGGGPPPAGAPVARPEPRGPGAPDAEPLNVEDREVLELTARARAEDAWADSESAPAAAALARALDPRRGWAAPARALDPRRGLAPPPRRPASCGPRPPTRSTEVAVQTVDAWPEPYEFIIADFYRNLPDDFSKEGSEPASPCERLDKYLSSLYAGAGAGAGEERRGEATEQLALLHAQLLYERWRREAHAERNRRLLGRCRQVRALELQNQALREHARAAQRERDALRARLQREPPPPPPQLRPEHEARLEAALAEERAARARAEAALREAEAARAHDHAELQRARGEAFEAARHVEALARGALAAERRAEHVRRLRRELLVLSEREARLTAAAQAALRERRAAAGAGEERAARAAAERLAAARAEAEAAAARAEAAAARAAELEAALAARDAVVAELKRAARAAAEEGAARLDALQDKYASLLRVLRAGELRRLARLAGEGARASPLPSPGGAAVSLADCSRVRRLLEEEEPRDS
ncbi:hamartin [Cydia pomonella]|uniref:hamartin n=1 Tax=Cydia pomonella TaxID=82600 RepID=UPI002ADDD972|nr:hamartin [Cydia pomonella]